MLSGPNHANGSITCRAIGFPSVVVSGLPSGFITVSNDSGPFENTIIIEFRLCTSEVEFEVINCSASAGSLFKSTEPLTLNCGGK